MATLMPRLVANRVYEVAKLRDWVQGGERPEIAARDLKAVGLGLMMSMQVHLVPANDKVPWKSYNTNAPHVTLVLSDHDGEALRFEAGHGPVWIDSLSDADINEALDQVLAQVREDDVEASEEEEEWYPARAAAREECRRATEEDMVRPFTISRPETSRARRSMDVARVRPGTAVPSSPFRAAIHAVCPITF